MNIDLDSLRKANEESLKSIRNSLPLLIGKPKMEKSVYMTLPHGGQFTPYAIADLHKPSLKGLRIALSLVGGSLLVRNFNNAWCQALNMNPRPDYFAMHHSDISTQPGWLDTLVELLETNNADVVSCNVPIKDKTGELSTAVYTDGIVTRLNYGRSPENYNQWSVEHLPATFDSNDIKAKCHTNGILLVNTGLWVCKFKDQPWVEKFCFKWQDQIGKDQNGQFHALGMPEDWMASLDWHQMGLKVMATSNVSLTHFGVSDWPFGGIKNNDLLTA